MKRRDFIKKSSLSALTAWVGSSVILNACHTEEDMIGEPNCRKLVILELKADSKSLSPNMGNGNLPEIQPSKKPFMIPALMAERMFQLKWQ